MSVSSAYRVLKRFYQPMNPFKTTLPTVLHFDEFKSVRQVSGAMSFIILKRNQSYFDVLLTQDISHLPATYQTTLRTFKKIPKTDSSCLKLFVFQWTIGVSK